MNPNWGRNVSQFHSSAIATCVCLPVPWSHVVLRNQHSSTSSRFPPPRGSGRKKWGGGCACEELWQWSTGSKVWLVTPCPVTAKEASPARPWLKGKWGGTSCPGSGKGLGRSSLLESLTTQETCEQVLRTLGKSWVCTHLGSQPSLPYTECVCSRRVLCLYPHVAKVRYDFNNGNDCLSNLDVGQTPF